MDIKGYFQKKADDIRNAFRFQTDPTQVGSYANRFYTSRPANTLVRFEQSPAGDFSKGMKNLYVDKPVQFGQQMGADLMDLGSMAINSARTRTLPTIQAPNTDPVRWQSLKDQTGRGISMLSSVKGVQSPKAVAGYAGLTGLINTAGEQMSGQYTPSAQNPFIKRAGENAIRGLDKAIPMAGVTSITNPYIDRVTNGLGAAARIPLKSSLNVGEGLIIDQATGLPTTKESIAIDAIFPVAGEAIGMIAKGLKARFTKAIQSKDIQTANKIVKEAEETLRRNTKIVNGKKLFRNAEGKVMEILPNGSMRYAETPMKTVKTTRKFPIREYGQPTRYGRLDDEKTVPALGLLGGIEITQDENGNPKINYNSAKGALGLGFMAGATKLKGKNLDDIYKSADIDRTKLTGMQLETPNAKLKAYQSGNPEEVLNTAKKTIGETEKPKSLRQGWDEFYANFVNRFQPIENIVNRAEKQGKMKIIPEQNPTYAIKRYLGAGGTAEFRHKRELDPIIKELGDVDKSDFDLFLKAKRDIELGKRGVYGSNADEGRGIIKALVEKHGEGVKNFDNVANKLYKYQEQGLQKLRDSGFIDEVTYQKIKDANKNYVPFQRVMDELDNYLGVPAKSAQQASQPVQKMKGSLRNIYSPMESIIANTYKTEAAVAKNRVTSTLVGLRKLGGEYEKLFTPVQKAGSDTISVWENGKKSYYQVPEEVSKAIKGLDEEASNVIVEILSAPARLLRQQATGRNIEFMIPNVIRDQLDAAMNSKYGYRPFIDYFSGLKEMIKARSGKSEVYDEWMKSGGKIFFENMAGRKAIKQQMEDATKQKNLVKRMGEWVIGGIDTIGKYSEEPTRVGLFKKAYQKTGNPLIGAMESREGSLDFARMGSKMKVANAVIPFLNVGVQGFDRMIRTIKDDPKRTALLLTTYGGLPAIASTLYNNIYHQEGYAQVPDFVKEGNFVIMDGNKDEDGNPTYLSIPKGHIVSLVANPTEAFINYAFQTNPQSMSQFALSFLSGQLPLVGQDDNLGGIARQTVGNLIPQAIKPMVEVTANHSFFKDAPIVSPYALNKPAELQTGRNTEEVYNRLGTLLGVSPLKAKSFIEGYLAGGVKQPMNIMKTLEAISRGENPSPNDAYVMRRLYGSYSGFDTERPMDTGAEPNLMERIGETFRPGGSEASTKTNLSTERVLNEVWRGRRPSGFSDNAYVYKDPDQDKPKQLDLTKFNKQATDPISKVRLDSDRYSEAIKVFRNESIPSEDKPELYKRMGVKEEDIAYYDIASDTEEIKRIVVDQVVDNSQDKKTLIDGLIRLSKPVSGKKVLSSGIIDDLYKEGVLSYTEKTFLSNLEFKNGNIGMKPQQFKAKKASTRKIEQKRTQLPEFNLDIKPISYKQFRIQGGQSVAPQLNVNLDELRNPNVQPPRLK